MRRRTFRIIFWLAIGVVGLGLVGWLVIGAVAADRLTIPTRSFNEQVSPADYGMAYENIDLTSRDGKTRLAGWYIPSEDNDRVIVFAHGRDASRTAAYAGPPDEQSSQPVPGKLLEFTRSLHEAGFSVLLIDLRGHGQSGEGRFSFGQYERLDVLAASDWLKEQGFQPGKIGIMGLSLGSAAAIGAMVADPQLGALVTDSGFADLSPIVRAQWVEESGLPMIFMVPTRWMVRLRYGWDMAKVRPVDEIGRVPPRPLMIIHCQDDEIVPVSQFEQLKAAAPSAETWLLQHCIHGQTYNAQPAVFTEKVIVFFDANLK
jgi:uncharacterized protein